MAARRWSEEICAVGFFLLTARPVFELDSDLDMATQVLDTPAQCPSRVALQPIPEVLDLSIYRCLAKSHADRPQTIDELIRAFDAWLDGHPWRGSCEFETERQLAQALRIDD